MAVPEATLWHLLSGLSMAPLNLFGFSYLIGLGMTLTAAAMDYAVKRWKWNSAVALAAFGLAGVPLSLSSGMGISFVVMPFMAIVDTDAPESNTLLPDDGMSSFARRMVKVQIVVLLGGILLGIGVALRVGQPR